MEIGSRLVEVTPLPNKILVAADCDGARLAGGWENFVRREHEARFGRLPALGVDQVRGEVQAFVRSGKWTVKCPFCGDHPYADEDLPFLCVMCGNAENGMRPMAVKFPVGRRLIEGILLRRPVVKTRGWFPGERLFDLVMENREHGIM